MSREAVSVLMAEYVPTAGRCPACDAPQDDGCRVITITRIVPMPGKPDGHLDPEREALRELILENAICIDVVCTSPALAEDRRRWRRANGLPVDEA